MHDTFALINSGASVHVVNKLSLFHNYTPLTAPEYVTVGDGEQLKVLGKGQLRLRTNHHTYILTNVLYVPTLQHNILSVSALCAYGLQVNFNNKYAYVYEQEDLEDPIMHGRRSNGLYLVDLSSSHKFDFAVSGDEGARVFATEGEKQTTETSTQTDIISDAQVEPDSHTVVCPDSLLWHQRLGHVSQTTLSHTHPTVTGLPDLNILNNVYDRPCEECLGGRFTAASHNIPVEKPDKPCALIFADTMGPFPKAYNGCEYALCVIDAYSGYAIVTPVKSKDLICAALKASIERFQMLSHSKVVELRTDNGTEFCNADVTEYLSDKCINISHSNPYTPQQVGMVERFNRTVLEICRSLLAQSQRSITLWPEALRSAAHLYNRRCSSSRSLDCTRYELFTGVKPDLSNLKVWGCTVYVKLADAELINKLEPKCMKGVFVGYDDFSTGYKVLLSGSVYVRGDVVFDERSFGNNVYKPDFVFEPQPTDNIQTDSSAVGQRAVKRKRERRVYEPTSGASAVLAKRQATVNAVDKLALDSKLYEHTYIPKPSLPSIIPGQELPIPQTYAEALSCEYSVFWAEAIKSELESIQDMGVFGELDLPPDKNVLTSKWVFTWKVNNNKVIKAKARLVVKGYEQRAGVDYTELYSPTVAQSTIRALLALAASNNSYVHQIDFKTAFLNGDLEEEVYMEIPEGAQTEGEGKVWRLYKSLYGLKQAPRCWFKKLKERLGILGYVQSDSDEALFIRCELDGQKSYVCVHVDDMLIMHNDKSVVLMIVDCLSKICEITDCGRSHEYLGITIEHTKSGIFIHQAPYAMGIVKKFLSFENMHASTPLAPNVVLHSITYSRPVDNSAKTAFDNPKLYASCVGSLMYLANFTRPDIIHAVNQLCKYNKCPSYAHWKAVQHVLAYVYHTYDLGLLYKRGSTPNCIGNCDASFCCDVDNSRSVTGYCFTMCGALVTWKSKQQTTVTNSTAEAEYLAINDAGKFGVHMKYLLAEMNMSNSAVPIVVGENIPFAEIKPGTKGENPMLIYSDSESAIAMVLNNHTTKNMKHVDKWHHWARERAEMGQLDFKHVSGKDNVADALTKFLPRDPFLKYRKKMGLVSWSSLKDEVIALE